MKLPLLFPIILITLGFNSLRAQDTITVQTFSFGSPQNAWFEFPSDTIRFEKILMLYTLKCNPAQNPACGEWDYLTNTYLYDHTGLTDSSIATQPLFSVNGYFTDSLEYSNTPTWTNTGNWQYQIHYSDTTSLQTFALDAGIQASEQPMATSNPVSRALYLWRASELTAAGMVAGNISGLRLKIISAGSELRRFTIRIKHTSADTLNAGNPDLSGFSEVYSCNTTPVNGWNYLAFLNSFNWDGVSNIIIEFSFENQNAGIDNMVESGDAGFTAGLYRAGIDRCLYFRGGGYVPVHITPALNEVDSAVSVCFWSYGNPDFQPQAGTSFEGVNAAASRMLNGHVPWSNSNVYWDAGNSSGYDRISKAAATSEIEGNWNHWVFTKNAVSGSMKMYLNGALWHSGTGLTRNIDSIASFRIGKGIWSGSESYEGRIDEFAVFKTELSAQDVADWNNKPISPLHPQYGNLVMHFGFNEGNGATVTDSANGNIIPSNLISVSNPMLHPDDYINGFTATSMRPDIVFEQGLFVSHIDSVYVSDSVMNTPVQVIFFADTTNNPGMPTDTMMVWSAGYYRYTYNSSGQVSDSLFVSPDSVLHQIIYQYYNYFPQVIRYELARYITPYGNGLSLDNGWTWTFDVTDYRKLLADSVHLAAGNWQELLDVKFQMIKGIPPRDVISIQNLWNGNFNYGFASNPIEKSLTPLRVKIPSNAVTARWKSRITGHGMDTPENCAEFCAKYHYYLVDSTERFSKLVWRDNCDINPLHPQGGTWVYDRANWCPGAEVWTYDFELTPFIISPDDSIELDHNVQPYSNNGEWDYFQIEDQLVTYGAPNFSLDAAIDNVIAPSTDKMNKHLNPICSAPIIVIRNTGATTLTTLDIDYGIAGTTPSTYYWAGNLPFMAADTVVLDTFAWAQGASEFIISIRNPNGGTDQYANNNTWKTAFKYVPVMPERFVIVLLTNNNPSENYYTVTDDQGNLVFERNNLAANTLYKDTITLTNGCYTFSLKDLGEDGLSFWANPSQGSGYIKFKSAESVVYLMNFIADFGGETYLQFTVGLTNSLAENSFTDKPMLKAYPNPASETIMVDFNLPNATDGVFEITDLYGKVVYSENFTSLMADSKTIDISSFTKGLYVISVKTARWLLSQKFIVR